MEEEEEEEEPPLPASDLGGVPWKEAVRIHALLKGKSEEELEASGSFEPGDEDDEDEEDEEEEEDEEGDEEAPTPGGASRLAGESTKSEGSEGSSPADGLLSEVAEDGSVGTPALSQASSGACFPRKRVSSKSLKVGMIPAPKRLCLIEEPKGEYLAHKTVPPAQSSV